MLDVFGSPTDVGSLCFNTKQKNVVSFDSTSQNVQIGDQRTNAFEGKSPDPSAMTNIVF
jgi:hypothetical protein